MWITAISHKNMFEDKNKNKFGGFEIGDTGMGFQEYRVNPRDHSYFPKIVQWVIKYSGGLVRNEQQANYVLLTAAIVVGVISILMLMRQWGAFQPSMGKIFYPPLPSRSPAATQQL